MKDRISELKETIIEIDKAIENSNQKGEVMDLLIDKDVLQDELSDEVDKKISEKLKALPERKLKPIVVAEPTKAQTGQAIRDSYECGGNCPYCLAEKSIFTYGVGREGWATECRECGELLDED